METDLFAAAKDGNIQTVRQAIDNGANVNHKNSEGLSAIMAAGFFGHVEVMKYLISKNADINAKNNSGGTTLMTATMNNHVAVVKLLTENGVDVNSKAPNGGTALVAAAQNGNEQIVELLLAAGADYNAAVKGYTPLKLAEANGYPNVVALIKAAQNGTLKAKPSQLSVAATSKFDNLVEKKEGCYIATAVYGSYEAPEVVVLRCFRDQILMRNSMGKYVVQLYYSFSPALSNCFGESRAINPLVKAILNVIVLFLKRLVFNRETFFRNKEKA